MRVTGFKPWWIVPVLLLLLVAACGDDAADDASPEPADDPAEAADESPEPADDPAEADEDAEAEIDDRPLEGETVNFVVPYGPGGGFDAQARIVGQYLEQELGATIAYDHQPGAGGMLALNSVAQAEPDGTTIAIMNLGAAIAHQIADSGTLRFDVADMTYLGRVYGGPLIVVTGTDNEIETGEEFIDGRPVRIAATGANVTGDLILEALGIDAGEVIRGFDGSAEAELAVVRGEVDATIGTEDSRAPSIDAGETRALFAVGEERSTWFPDIPALLEIADVDDDARELIMADTELQLLYRVIVAPPGMDPALATYLQTAFENVLHSDELNETAEEQNRPMIFMSGGELLERIPGALDVPEVYRELLQSVL